MASSLIFRFPLSPQSPAAVPPRGMRDTAPAFPPVLSTEARCRALSGFPADSKLVWMEWDDPH